MERDFNIHEWQAKYLKENNTQSSEQAKISPDNRVAYLANTLDHVWKMGTGKNSIDYDSLAQSIVDDLFGTDME